MDRIPFNMNPGRHGPDPGRPRGPRSRGRRPLALYIVGALILAVLLLGPGLVRWWVDWRWFAEVGGRNVFWTLFAARWGLALAAFVAFLVLALPNVWLALRLAPPPAIPVDLRGQVEMIARQSLAPLLYGFALLFAVFAGLAAMGEWQGYLLFSHAVPFGVADPLFHKDVGFYVFRLPFIEFALAFVTGALFLALIGVAFTYGVTLAHYYDPMRGWPVAGRRVPPQAATHVSLLVSVLLLLKAADYWLNRYHLLYNVSPVVSGGASYVDVHARLPLLVLLAVLCVLAALVWAAQLAAKKLTWGIGAIVVLIIVSIIGAIYPSFVQQVRVKPNELTAEEPYIARNIAFTRRAYGLQDARQTDFPIRNDFRAGLVRRNAATLDNARLWDYSIAVQAYQQLQEIKPYYEFTSVDVDRYTLGNRYRQVLISAREMDQTLLPDQAKSFQNTHLVYTHGIGFVMSPVNEVSPDGQPVFLVKGIPPVAPPDLKISQARIYFGESPMTWSVVGGGTREFDYPTDQDVYTQYTGKAGIRVGGFLSRLALASYLGDQNFLLSPIITPESKLLIRRRIDQRIRPLAPFLALDHDPYPVLADGRLVWLQDAYTTTDRYPYSEPVNPEGDPNLASFNYIRNSVKVAVDAYDGTVSLYAADETDPLLQAWRKVFPDLIRPLSDMPPALRAHVRYPEDLFEIQSRKYRVYHMTDPKIFFTKEDAWDLPRSASGTVGEGGNGVMEAYYVVLKLPGSSRQEMVMIRPFTPKSKNNMIAWMAAGCDPGNYGRIQVYRFPLDNLPLGPAQVDASIVQKPDISKELTLLNQQGSQVVLGNMLTLPLEHSLLYIQPLYVQTSNRGNSRAELARVIVAYADRVQMAPSLSEALDALFGAGAAGPATTPTGAPAPSGAAPGQRALIDRAVQAFNRAQSAQRNGDWAGYGAALKDLEKSLRALQQGG